MNVEFYRVEDTIDTNISASMHRGLKDLICIEARRLHTKPGLPARNLIIRGLIASGARMESLGVVKEGVL